MASVQLIAIFQVLIIVFILTVIKINCGFEFQQQIPSIDYILDCFFKYNLQLDGYNPQNTPTDLMQHNKVWSFIMLYVLLS